MDSAFTPPEQDSTTLLPAFTPPPNRTPDNTRLAKGNINAVGKDNLPTIYKLTPEEVQTKIDGYIQECKQADRSATVPGLAYALGFNSKQALYKALAGDDRDDREACIKRAVVVALKRAKLFLEAQCLGDLVDGKGFGIGRMFNLKVNHGYIETAHVVTDNHLHITWHNPEQKPEMIKDIEHEDD